MKATSYLRCSTSAQADSGAGLDAQRDAIERYCAREGLSLAAEYADEGISGAKGIEKREGLLGAVAALQKGDALIVAKRDRLGRDPIVVAMIERMVERRGARIVSAAGEGTEGDDPTNKLMRRIIDAFAEYERLIIGARTKAALQAKKARGERVGHVGYGHRLMKDGVHLEEVPKELEAIEVAKQAKAEGLSLRKIAALLTKRGFRPRGKAWHATTVMRILEGATA